MLSFFDGLVLGVFLAIFGQWFLKTRETSPQRIVSFNIEPSCQAPAPEKDELSESPTTTTSTATRTTITNTTTTTTITRIAMRDEEENLKYLNKWLHMCLNIIRKTSNWENAVTVLHQFATSPSGPTMLSVARRKSLCLQDFRSFTTNNKIGSELENRNTFGNNNDDEDDGEGDDDDNDYDEEDEDEEEIYWKERENLTSERYSLSTARPLTAYFPLQLLKSDQTKRFDLLTCLPSNENEQISPFGSGDQTMRRPSIFDDLDSTFIKLSRVAQEFIETEKVFVRDIGKLILLLTELQYSTLSPVREFVQTVPFVGILSSIVVIQTLHSELLNRIQDSLPSENQFTDLLLLELFYQKLFNSLELFAPFLSLLAQYVIHHDSFSNQYNKYMCSLEEFNYFLSNSERLIGETMASLIIKPVQRLPRYVLLCNEMKKIFLKAVEKATHYSQSTTNDEIHTYPPNMTQILHTLSSSCHDICQLISEAAHTCNEKVRKHQDTIRMHDLHNMMISGGSELTSHVTIVVKERRFIKEGDLFRHHKNSSMRLHRIQLFSDVLLSSASSATGTSLYLEQQISLTENSGTFCIPIPSPTLERDLTLGNCTHWFLLGAAHKNLYFGCKTEGEMMKWVDAIQNCLSQNKAEADYGKFLEQLGLINLLINEIDTQRQILRRSSVNSISLQEFQTCWWRLLNEIESMSSTDSTPRPPSAASAVSAAAGSSSLQKISRQIHQHSRDVASNLILSIHCDELDFVEGKSPVQQLLFTDKAHYLIATGLFFEYSRTSASIVAGERPSIVRVFLFHDFLLAAYCKYINTPLLYAFHIPLAHLKCSDYRNDVGELAILLEDTSNRTVTRRKSMFDRLKSFGEENQNHEVRRLLFAPTLNMKFDWLTLLMQSISSIQLSQISTELSLPSVRGRISLDINPLKPLWIEEQQQQQL